MTIAPLSLVIATSRSPPFIHPFLPTLPGSSKVGANAPFAAMNEHEKINHLDPNGTKFAVGSDVKFPAGE